MKSSDTKDQWVLMALGLIPDAVIAFVLMKLTNDEWSTFWWTWVVIQVVAMLYWLRNVIWGSIVWRLFLRRRAVDQAKHVLRECRFPSSDDSGVDDYLSHLVETDSQPVTVRLRAAQWHTAIELTRRQSIQRSLQINEAWDEALKAHRKSGVGMAGPAPA